MLGMGLTHSQNIKVSSSLGEVQGGFELVLGFGMSGQFQLWY